MALIDYTTYDDIRAVLGVSNEELEDVTLALGLYSTNLGMELDTVNASVSSQYATIAAIVQASRTAVQQRFYEATRLFATYAVAKQLGSGLPLFGPKDITDGKASQSRFADSPYKETLKKVDEYYGRMRNALADAYSGLSASTRTAAPRTMLAVSGLSVDPVTGS